MQNEDCKCFPTSLLLLLEGCMEPSSNSLNTSSNGTPMQSVNEKEVKKAQDLCHNSDISRHRRETVYISGWWTRIQCRCGERPTRSVSDNFDSWHNIILFPKSITAERGRPYTFGRKPGVSDPFETKCNRSLPNPSLKKKMKSAHFCFYLFDMNYRSKVSLSGQYQRSND